MDPEPPRLFSVTPVDPSGKVNSAEVMEPSAIEPVQVRVVVYGSVPEDGDRLSDVHTGALIFWGVGELYTSVGVAVGVSVGVGELYTPVGVAVGVGVLVGVCVGVGVALRVTYHQGSIRLLALPSRVATPLIIITVCVTGLVKCQPAAVMRPVSVYVPSDRLPMAYIGPPLLQRLR